MIKSIPYGKQYITDEDIQAVADVLRSDFLTQGPTVSAFETAFKTYVGADYASAVSNGTTALHLAALALNVQPGDKIITTPITFAASANCIRYCGGELVFADIDPDTYLLDISSVERLLQTAPIGTYKGIVVVDFAGKAIDLEAYRTLADQYKLWIIEDACHAPGAFFIDSTGEKQLAGNGKWADISVFSFHPVKHIAMGEGGALTTNNKILFDRIQLLRTHGIHKDSSAFTNSIAFAGGETTYPLWYMEMQDLGYNYRLTDMQAALGLSQLKRADTGLARRREIAQQYASAFESCDYILRQSGVDAGHAYHLYVIEVNDRLGLYEFLRSKSIFAQIHYIPCHLMPYYRNQGWKEGDLPHAENYYRHCISIPMFPSLSDDEVNYVIQTIKTYFGD
jgi:hypothetical protein